MRKTSVYLDEEQAKRVARLAREEGRSQAEILREAVASYQPKQVDDRDFALSGSGRGDGSSIADVPEQELLEGFGHAAGDSTCAPARTSGRRQAEATDANGEGGIRTRDGV